MAAHNPLPAKTPLIAVTAIITFVALASAAAPPQFSTDGWHTWQVEAVDDAPNWCCMQWTGDSSHATTCELDSRGNASSFSANEGDSPRAMQIYLRMENGVAVELRTLSASCPVRSRTTVANHGTFSQAQSVAWLRRQVSPRGKLSGPALVAIAVHAGDEARRFVLDTAQRGSSMENRKDAVFWMGQVRANDTAEQLQALMFDDPSTQMRRHAAFSWSQSSLDDRGAALIRLGQTDTSPEVRGQAFFWLTQTGDAASEEAIHAALAREDSRKVRDEAIFALSQLPDERGVTALIDVLENPARADADRRQALFWLAQSDSDRALDYLARVLE